MMASVTLAVWQIPTATATSLEEIKVSSEISAPVDQVWNIVSDVDDETKYWPTFKSIKNINKTNNITEREVTIVTDPQGDFETSVRDLKDSYRPNLTIYIKYEIE